MKTLIILMFIVSHAQAYSTLECTGNSGLSYSFSNKVRGARPRPGMITHIEEIRSNNEIVFRNVTRQQCRDNSDCEMQNPELTNIMPPDFSFQFVASSKTVLSSEGDGNSPERKETYAIKILFQNESWMICDSFFANYP